MNQKQLGITPEQIKAYNDTVNRIIKENSFFIQSVSGDKNFIYTAGLSLKGFPEIFVKTYSVLLCKIVEELAENMIKRNLTVIDYPFETDITIVKVVDNDGSPVRQNLRARLVLASPEQNKTINEQYAYAASDRFGLDIKWVILEVGDESNKLPGEDGYTAVDDSEIKI